VLEYQVSTIDRAVCQKKTTKSIKDEIASDAGKEQGQAAINRPARCSKPGDTVSLANRYS